MFKRLAMLLLALVLFGYQEPVQAGNSITVTNDSNSAIYVSVHLFSAALVPPSTYNGWLLFVPLNPQVTTSIDLGMYCADAALIIEKTTFETKYMSQVRASGAAALNPIIADLYSNYHMVSLDGQNSMSSLSQADAFANQTGVSVWKFPNNSQGASFGAWALSEAGFNGCPAQLTITYDSNQKACIPVFSNFANTANIWTARCQGPSGDFIYWQNASVYTGSSGCSNPDEYFAAATGWYGMCGQLKGTWAGFKKAYFGNLNDYNQSSIDEETVSCTFHYDTPWRAQCGNCYTWAGQYRDGKYPTP